MNAAARRIVPPAAAALAAGAFFLWRSSRGFDTPIETFKAWAGAGFLLVATFVVLSVVVQGPARRDYVRKHRRVAALIGGLIVALVFFGLLEGTFFLLNKGQKGVTKDSGRFVQTDPLLGYSLLPGADVDASCKFGDEVVYRTRYSIDEHGNRRTPSPTAAPRRACAFFGCSFTFGEGLKDDETLASRYAALVPDEQAVNCGVPGHGPNHVLARLEDARELWLPKCPEPPRGVYLYMDAHVDRAIGSMYVVNHFGSDAPYYGYDDGRLVRRGDFIHGRPGAAVAYWLLGKSQVLQHFGFNWPPAGRASSVELTGDVVARCAQEFKRRTGGSYTMVVYPGSAFGRRVAERVRSADVRILDYTDLFDPNAPGESLPHDGHPSAQAISKVADRLAADLSGR